MGFNAGFKGLTGRNAVTRHPCIMGLIDNLLCRKCGAEEETSGHVLRKCEHWSHLNMTTWLPFSWTQREFRSVSLGAFWNVIKGTGLP